MGHAALNLHSGRYKEAHEHTHSDIDEEKTTNGPVNQMPDEIHSRQRRSTLLPRLLHQSVRICNNSEHKKIPNEISDMTNHTGSTKSIKNTSRLS